MDCLKLIEKDYDDFTAEELNLAASILFAYQTKCEDYGIDEEDKALISGLGGIANQISNDADAIILEGGTPQTPFKNLGELVIKKYQ